MDRTLTSFSSPATHAAVSEIIHRLSDNKTDIRDVALAGLDLSGVRTVLDLGCGFGFLSEKVLPRVAPEACLTGVDACEENRGAFLRTAEQAGHAAEFHCLKLPARLPWGSESFDLILASYALYFFVDQLAEISRVMRPGGLLLAITHSESSFRNLHEAIGLEECPTPFQALIRNFSAENGEAKLRAFLERVEKLEYRNTLRFDVRHLTELVQYVQFKLPLLFAETEIPAVLRATLHERLRVLLEQRGPFALTKDDAVFRGWQRRAR